MNDLKRNISYYHLSRLVFGLIATILLPCTLLAQASDQILLTDYLKELEEERGVSFTYVEETVKDIYIVKSADSLSIERIIDYLQINTGLRFEILNGRYIAISAFEPGMQFLCGYLIDKEDSSNVINAAISIGKQLTVSDSTGYFELVHDFLSQFLIINRVGYLEKSVNLEEIDSSSCETVFLTPKVMQLDEVTIMNILTSGISKSKAGEVRVDTENLGVLPGLIEPDVLQTIQYLPGIQSVNETVSDINIRGGTNDQNLVLWDGIKMYQTGHFFGLISAFNPYLTKDVTITKNGSTAALGDAVSSTIAITSDNDHPSRFTGGAGVNMLSVDAFVKIPINSKISLQLAGRRSITDLIKTPVYNSYFERVFRNTDVTQYSSLRGDTTLNSDENFLFYDFSGNLMFDLGSKDKIRIHFLHIFNDLAYKENIVAGGNSDSKTSSLTQQSLVSGINYKRQWNNKLTSTINLDLSTYSLRGINFDILNNQRVIQENEVLDTRITLDTRWLLNRQWDILIGYQFFETGIGNLEEVNDPEFFRYLKQVIRSHVAYIEANFSPTLSSDIRFGLRGNYYNKFQRFIPEPRIAIRQDLGSGFSLELLGEFKNQVTTQVIDLQNDFLGVEKRRWILANETDVPIVQSKQLSLASTYNSTGFLLSLEGFYKHVTGITTFSQGFQNQFQYVRSSGDYNVMGAELLINYNANAWSLWSGYTYSVNTYDFQELIPQEFPNNLDIQHALSTGINYNIGKFETSVGFSWHTGKPYTEAIGSDNNGIIYAEPNSARLPNYFRTDMSIRYSFRISERVKGRVGASIWNLSNHQNIYNIYYALNNDNSLRRIEQEALRITPNLMFRINF